MQSLKISSQLVSITANFLFLAKKLLNPDKKKIREPIFIIRNITA